MVKMFELFLYLSFLFSSYSQKILAVFSQCQDDTSQQKRKEKKLTIMSAQWLNTALKIVTKDLWPSLIQIWTQIQM